MAVQLEPERKEWLKRVAKDLRIMMKRLHGPLMKAITEDMGFEESTFGECLQRGFPVAGQMVNSVVGMVPDPKLREGATTMNSLWNIGPHLMRRRSP